MVMQPVTLVNRTSIPALSVRKVSLRQGEQEFPNVRPGAARVALALNQLMTFDYLSLYDPPTLKFEIVSANKAVPPTGQVTGLKLKVLLIFKRNGREIKVNFNGFQRLDRKEIDKAKALIETKLKPSLPEEFALKVKEFDLDHSASVETFRRIAGRKFDYRGAKQLLRQLKLETLAEQIPTQSVAREMIAGKTITPPSKGTPLPVAIKEILLSIINNSNDTA